MVNFCSVIGCGKRSNRDSGISFYRLPAIITHQGDKTKELSEKRRRLWLARINRGDFKPSDHSRVCSTHFVTGKPSQLYDEENPDWAPSLKLHVCGSSPGQSESSVVAVSRYERAQQRREKRRKLYDSEEEIGPSGDQLEPCEQNTAMVGCQTELRSEDIVLKDEYEKLKEEHEALTKSHRQFVLQSAEKDLEEVVPKEQCNCTVYDESDFRDKDDKVRFFTGLTDWDTLWRLFKFVRPHLVGHSSLKPFQQLMLTLMRLRLGSSGIELGYKFGVHPSTVSRIFSDVIEMLYVKLSFLIVWPEREVLRKTLPMQFRRNYPNCVAIIDCFEIFIDRPTDLLARAIAYSSYKHHNTVKYLIAITPQGSVSFISDGWGGRASDKHITENSGFFDKLLPGDTILADRGFDIRNSLGFYAATVKIPAFTKGKKQLEGIEVEQTRAIANVRIHVERVIGNIRKKYQILRLTQPIDYLISKTERINNAPLLDMIVTVCCTLNNICNSVVPFD